MYMGRKNVPTSIALKKRGPKARDKEI